MFSYTLLLAFLAAGAHAAILDVNVGLNGTFTYNPPYVIAKPGDMIKFKYFPKNHSVTQSSFENPCSRMPGGFDSGFMPVTQGDDMMQPTFNITVNDTKPIWLYCRQKNHCQMGMVMAINPPQEGNRTYEEFLEEALALGDSTTSSATSYYTSPPPPTVETVSEYNTMYTTTYASWESSSSYDSTISSATSYYTSPPPPTVETVSEYNTMYTTTYASWESSSSYPTPAASSMSSAAASSASGVTVSLGSTLGANSKSASGAGRASVSSGLGLGLSFIGLVAAVFV